MDASLSTKPRSVQIARRTRSAHAPSRPAAALGHGCRHARPAGRLLIVEPEFLLDGKLGVIPRSRYDNLQGQNRTLAERASAQQAEIENLKLHTRNVENQLIRAEEDLARLDDRGKADRHKLASSKRPHEGLESQPGYGGNAMPAELSSRLADLADRYPSLHYDEESGVSKFDTDVLFDSGEARLTVPARKMLGEFAEIFQAPEARDLKIMVVGHTDARGIKGREARSKYPEQLASECQPGRGGGRLPARGRPAGKPHGHRRLCPISTDFAQRHRPGPQKESAGRNLRRGARNPGRRLDRNAGQRRLPLAKAALERRRVGFVAQVDAARWRPA